MAIEPAKKVEFVRSEQDYLLRYIGLADTRGIALATSITTIYGLYFAAWSSYNKDATVPLWSNSIIFWIVTVLFSLTVSSAIGQLWPEPYSVYRKTRTLTHYFFSSQIGDSKGYVNEITALTDDEALSNIQLEHCYNLARITTNKMRYLSFSFFTWSLTLIIILGHFYAVLWKTIAGSSP